MQWTWKPEWSVVQRGSVLGLVLFYIFINVIDPGTASWILNFADNIIIKILLLLWIWISILIFINISISISISIRIRIPIHIHSNSNSNTSTNTNTNTNTNININNFFWFSVDIFPRDLKQ